MHRAPTHPEFLRYAGTALAFAHAPEQQHGLAGRQPAARKDRPGVEVVDPRAVFAAIIDQPPLGVAKHSCLCDTSLAARAAQALRVTIVGDPAAALGLV